MSSGDEQEFEVSSGLTQEIADIVFEEGAPELTDQEAEDGAKAWDEVSHQYDRIQYDRIPYDRI